MRYKKSKFIFNGSFWSYIYFIYIKYNYNKFIKDETLKPPNGYKAYDIYINNLINKTEYTDNIYKKLLQRYKSC